MRYRSDDFEAVVDIAAGGFGLDFEVAGGAREAVFVDGEYFGAKGSFGFRQKSDSDIDIHERSISG